ncbi:MAG: alpha/beta hydrolase [Actinomycetota bacterium]
MQTTVDRRHPAPPLWMTLLETRAAFEYASWRASTPWLNRLPKGDGHPVLVLPGFTADDRSTQRLRILLRRLGYSTYGWRLGANIGPTPEIIGGLQQRVDRISERNDGQKISLVGWSLGGIFARLLVRTEPERFRQVITLGSPFGMSPGDRSAVSALWDSVSHLHDESYFQPLLDRSRPPLPIPTTSIYTRTDGIVHWKYCLERRGPLSQNIEVYGSHSGLGFNPAVGYAVANRLAQPLGEWKRFRPPIAALAAYPPAAYASDDSILSAA